MRVGNTACPASMTTRDVAQVSTDGIRACVTPKFESPDPGRLDSNFNAFEKSTFRLSRGAPLRQPSMQIFDPSAAYF